MTCCWHTKMHMVVTVLVIVGALNWGAQAFCLNFVDAFSKNLNKLLGTKICFNRYVYILVAICGLILAMKRSTWYPYSSKSIFPEHLLLLHTPPNANKKVLINVKPNSKVAYWTGMYDKWESEVNSKLLNKYGNRERNSGVVMSDEFGNTDLLFEDYDDLDKTFKHIHYRVFGYGHNMMSDVKKIYF
jgi:uncharacterized membrane protein YuzA (DUF378 family)